MTSVTRVASFSVHAFSAALLLAALPSSLGAQEPAPLYNVVTDAVLFDGGPSLGNSDRVRWDFYKANRAGVRSDVNAGGSYDATFEAKLPKPISMRCSRHAASFVLTIGAIGLGLAPTASKAGPRERI